MTKTEKTYATKKVTTFSRAKHQVVRARKTYAAKKVIFFSFSRAKHQTPQASTT